VLVPVNLDDSDGVNQVNLALSYDTSRLQLLGVQAGSLTQPAEGFTVSSDVDPQAGVLVVNATSAQPLSGAGAGSVAVLEFQVKLSAPAGAAVVNLDASVPATAVSVLGADSTQLSGVDGQGDPAIFVLSPGPSNVPGSPDDGLVNVLAAPAPVAEAPVQSADDVQSPVVTSVQVASAPAGLPGAAIVNVLSGQSVPSKVMVGFPAVPVSSTGTAGGLAVSFFQQYGSTSRLSPDQAWLVQAPDQRSADPWQLAIESGLDLTDTPWWDTPAAG